MHPKKEVFHSTHELNFHGHMPNLQTCRCCHSPSIIIIIASASSESRSEFRLLCNGPRRESDEKKLSLSLLESHVETVGEMTLKDSWWRGDEKVGVWLTCEGEG